MFKQINNNIIVLQIEIILPILLVFPLKAIGTTNPDGGFIKVDNANPVRTQLIDRKLFRGSCVECASFCLVNRMKIGMCSAFTCDPLDKTCDLYARRTPTAIPQNINLYLFRVTDVFHPVTVAGQKYSIYLSSAEAVSFLDAKIRCERLNSKIYYLESMEDDEAIRIVLIGHEFIKFSFVGTTKNPSDGQWLSDRDGSVIDKSLLRWDDGEPDNRRGIEYCARIHYPNYKIHDVRCDTKFTFLCKRSV